MTQPPPPSAQPGDERQMILARAVREADLDRVVAMLRDSFPAPQHTVRSTLKWIFDAAARDGIDLLSPPPGFQAWLADPLSETRKGPATAKPNTVRTRLTLLGAMYRALFEEGLIQSDPLFGIRRPAAQRQAGHLPDRASIERLVAQTTDLEMKAALLLITRQAFSTGEVLALKWSDIEPARGWCCGGAPRPGWPRRFCRGCRTWPANMAAGSFPRAFC
ncbi:hypothetical protein ACFP81_12965 [Deinococcus lacus]|uniref:Uncharacterized protein n=1 Tax=Deinococcus lacus TaxID=392561 RepID=A0ABW1YEP7_9DEIO